MPASGCDLELLERALRLARPHHPHPNPRVGAVVVGADGRIVGEGAHLTTGSDHAEVVALAAAGEAARNGTLYVTLEPCSHQGRTPPCADAVIAAGVTRVVVGVADPDPAASGGAARLRRAGIFVDLDVAVDACVALDPGYFHHRRTGRPLVTLKLAATLDGQAAAADGTSQWITGDAARHDVHRLRSVSDAVMVGAGTLRTDDPTLDVRLGRGTSYRRPRPVIVAGGEPLPATAKVYSRHALVYVPSAPDVTSSPHPGPGVEVVAVSGGTRVDLGEVLDDLGRRQIVDLLVEGGPTLAAALLADGLVDRIVWYLGARLGGGVGRPVLPGIFRTLADARMVHIEQVTMLGGDIRITAVPGSEAAAPRGEVGVGAAHPTVSRHLGEAS